MAQMKMRVMEVQSHVYDMYGNPLFTPDMIEAYLQKNAQYLKRWQWTMHDKDKYSHEEVKRIQLLIDDGAVGLKPVTVDDLKPTHIHLALEFVNAVYMSSVAKEFGLLESMIQKPKSRYNQFLNMARYQTHEMPEEQAKGKHRYDDSEVHANYDFRAEFDRMSRVADRAKARGMKKAEVQDLLEEIERGGISPEEVRQKYGYAFYQEREKEILKARSEYIKRYYTPSLRINFYVDAAGLTHGGRVGKTQLCKMLARSLFPQLLDSECFFEVGSSRAGLQAYREQPVIIWNDMRAVDMVQVFGRPELLNMLDDHPGKTESRILYGTVIPVQKFNIINGIEPYDEFLKGLAGTYTDRNGNHVEAEDESQVFGRFPFIIHVSTEWIDFLVSQGWLEGTREFETYQRFTRTVGGIRRLMKGYDGKALNYLGAEASRSVVAKVREIEAMDNSRKITDISDIRDDDIPLQLNAEQADELERRLYNIYVHNTAGDSLSFNDWLSVGQGMLAMKDRYFTSSEIREVVTDILSSASVQDEDKPL